MNKTQFILFFLCLSITIGYSQGDIKLGKVRNSNYNHELSYLYYQPKFASSADTLPLLIYLHSSGTISENPFDITKIGVLNLVKQGKDLPFFIIAPQLPFEANKEWSPDFVDIFITHILEKYPIDPKRVSITGFSIGATGAWDYACKYPNKIASLVPVSGWGDPQKMCALKNIPIWVFHGSDDNIVNPVASRSLTKALKNCGGDVILTEMEGIGHDAWESAYSTPYLFEWMESKKMDIKTKKSPIRVSEQITAYPLPRPLHAIKGLAYLSGSQFLGISEKGNSATLIQFDTLGNIDSMHRIMGAGNLQWEELRIDSNGDLNILDGGNRSYTRTNFQLYILKKGDLLNPIINCKPVNFTASKNIMFTSLFWMDDQMVLTGKQKNNPNVIFYTLHKDKEDALIAEQLSEIKVPELSEVTSSLYRENKSLFLLGPEGIIELQNFSLGNPNIPKLVTRFPNMTKKVALISIDKTNLAYADQYFFGKIDGNLYIHLLKD